MISRLKKEKALNLRKSGKSIGQIAEALSVSKSVVSYWCKNIALSTSQIESLRFTHRTNSVKALLRYQEGRRIKRIADVRSAELQGARDVGGISERDLFMLGLGLYWAEGYKKGNEELGFTNSEASIVLTFLKWLETFYQVPKSSLILRVSVNSSHRKFLKRILGYWSRTTGIPFKQFTKTSIIQSKRVAVYPNPNTYYGTLRIKVRRGTNLRRRIMGSIKTLGNSVQ